MNQTSIQHVTENPLPKLDKTVRRKKELCLQFLEPADIVPARKENLLYCVDQYTEVLHSVLGIKI